VPEENVHVICEVPFSAALRRSYETGLNASLPWTFCVDADVLLRPGAIAEMVRLAEEQPDHVCEIQGYMLDKLFATTRPGGVHLYRTEHLRLALECIPQEGVNVRPEHYTLQTMKSKGYPWVEVTYVVGLHDFEQYYRDIFRKCFVQAHKHAYLSDKLLTVWRERAAQDADYAVALLGFGAGVQHTGKVFIDTRQREYHEGFAQLGIDEKGPLNAETVTLEWVEDTILTWQIPDCWEQPAAASHAEPENRSRWHRIRQRIATLGLPRASVYLLGRTICKVGNRIVASALRERKVGD